MAANALALVSGSALVGFGCRFTHWETSTVTLCTSRPKRPSS
jgi:hypothetical protein